ncbi:MAG: hypothetical protein QXD49_03655 [Archaeoglobaceae archaeon]
MVKGKVGITKNISVTDSKNLEINPRKYPEKIPMNKPKVDERIAENMLTKTETLVAIMSSLSTSSPTSFVPKRWLEDGGEKTSPFL